MSLHSGGVAPQGGVGGACLRGNHVTDWIVDDLKNEKEVPASKMNSTLVHSAEHRYKRRVVHLMSQNCTEDLFPLQGIEMLHLLCILRFITGSASSINLSNNNTVQVFGKSGII